MRIVLIFGPACPRSARRRGRRGGKLADVGKIGGCIGTVRATVLFVHRWRGPGRCARFACSQTPFPRPPAGVIVLSLRCIDREFTEFISRAPLRWRGPAASFVCASPAFVVPTVSATALPTWSASWPVLSPAISLMMSGASPMAMPINGFIRPSPAIVGSCLAPTAVLRQRASRFEAAMPSADSVDQPHF